MSQDRVDKLASLERKADSLQKRTERTGVVPENAGTVEFSNDGKTMTVRVYETGVLAQLVEGAQGYVQDAVEDVIISTEPGAFLNYRDFFFLRKSLPNIKRLDFSRADCLNDFDPSNPVEFAIPRDAMGGNATLKEVVLSQTATSIGRGAFSGCSGLRGDLVIPDSVTHIGKAAFGFWGNKFPQFSSLTLSKNLEVLEAGAFLRSKIDGTIVLPESLRIMEGDGTFGGAFQETNPDRFVFPENGSLEFIGNFSFSGCTKSTGTIKLNEGVREIGKYAFASCSSLGGELALPSTLTKIDGAAFIDCSSLTGSLELPDSLTFLGASAFQGCSGITGLTIGSGLTEIPTNAFIRCTGLAGTVEIPAGVTVVRAGAFNGCSSLQGLVFHEGLETIERDAFNGTASLRGDLRMPSTLMTIGNYAFHRSGADGTLTLPDEMDVIGDGAFYFGGLSGLRMPKRLNTLGANAFAYNANMACDGLVIPAGLRQVPAGAFNGCKAISGTLVIPDEVVSIGANAIRESAIERIEFGSGLTEIGDYAFTNCRSLTSVGELPAGLMGIGHQVFAACSELAGDIVLPEGLVSLGTLPFRDTKITSIEYHGSGVTDWTNVLSTQNQLQRVDLSGSAVTKLKWVNGQNALTDIKLPATLVELNMPSKTALEDIDLTVCTGLSNVNLKACAIDFSGGKPKQWLDSYTGAKDITGQNIMLYGERGATRRTIEVNGAFTDDFVVKTKNGTDLSSPAAWTAFRNANQMGLSANGWIQTNRLPQAFPVSRNPAMNVPVDTSKEGVQTITYTTGLFNHPSLYKALNYSVELTVGAKAPAPEDVTLSVKAWNGGAIGVNGVTRTYLDLPFNLIPQLSNGATPERVTWKLYADAQMSSESTGVLRLNDEGKFETAGVGSVWVVAQAEVGGKMISSAPAKVTVNPFTYHLNLGAGKAKTYGYADAAGLGFPTYANALGGRVDLDMNFTRDEGEDVGKYQVYLYSLEELGLDGMERGTQAFWDAYKPAAEKLFKEKNPNFKLNLTVPKPGAPGNYSINQYALANPVFGVVNKKYDATTDCELSGADIFRVLMWDDAEKLEQTYEARYVSPNVKYNAAGAVAPQDVVVTAHLRGAQASNYRIPYGYEDGVEKNGMTWHQADDGSFTVTIKKTGYINPLTLSCDLKPLSKVYDGTAAAYFESPEAFAMALRGLCEEDQKRVGSITAEFADENAGESKNVRLVSDQIEFSNYKMPELKADIKPKALAVDGLSAQDKTYDGTTAAKLTGSPEVDPSGVISGDDVSIDEASLAGDIKGSFADANAGSNKRVVVTGGFGLTGADAANYFLNTPEDVVADILPAPMTVMPSAGQFKQLGAVDPVYTYGVSGAAPSDLKADGSLAAGILRGSLSRSAGEATGEYAFALGSLVSNGNYVLTLDKDAPVFEIRDIDASLKGLSVDGGELDVAFSPVVHEYIAYLPFGTSTVPEVAATATSKGAAVAVEPAKDLSGKTVITVTAADGQTSEVYTVAFRVADAVTLEVATVGVSAADASDGAIMASAQGGLGSLEYSIDGSTWVKGGTFSNLAVGDYVVRARDSRDHGNAAQAEVSLGVVDPAAPAPAPFASLEVAAGQDLIMPYSEKTHTVQVVARGGEAGVTPFYHLEGQQAGASMDGDVLTVHDAGTYKVCAHAVRDGVSSEGVKLNVSVERAGRVAATAAVTDCVVWGGDGGSVTIAATGGLGSYEYRIESGDWQDGATFEHLPAGTYEVAVRDKADTANVASLIVEVGQPAATDAAAVHAVRDMLANGKIALGDLSKVTSDLDLPETVTYGKRDVKISWASSDEDAISTSGKVNRPPHVDKDGKLSEEAHVTLTATVSVGGVSRTVTFEAVVIPEDHSFVGDWTGDDAAHWHECSCGLRADEASHTFGEWIVVEAPTETVPGTKRRTCTVCGRAETAGVPAVGGQGSPSAPSVPGDQGRPGATPSNPGAADGQNRPGNVNGRPGLPETGDAGLLASIGSAIAGSVAFFGGALSSKRKRS